MTSTPRIPTACTGTIELEGLVHEGDRCPVHEIDDPGDTRTDDEILTDDAEAYRESYAEDSVTDDLATARRWFAQDGGVVVNEEDGASYLHTFGAFPVAGVESYQRNGGGG